MSSEQTEEGKSKFKKFDRVRVTSGIDRGHYGTVISVGGAGGAYCVVKLDCHPEPVEYSTHELDAVLRGPPPNPPKNEHTRNMMG